MAFCCMVGLLSTESIPTLDRYAEGNDIDIPVGPCTTQEGDILLSTKKIASCNRQSGYGNFLRCRFCWRLTSSDKRRGKAFHQPLASDSTPCAVSACYRRYRLEKF